MKPDKLVGVDRAQLCDLTQLPNIGVAMAKDLKLLGIESPQQLVGKDPVQMYRKLEAVKGKRQDPCVCDIFMSAVCFMNGEPPLPWWKFSEKRRALLASEK